MFTYDAAVREVVRRTVADRLKRNVFVDQRERTLTQPDCGGERPREFLKRGPAEEMRHTDDAPRIAAPERRVQRRLVDVFEQDVEWLVAKMPRPMREDLQREGLPRSDAVHVDSVERRARRTVRPPAAEQRDLMAA